MSLNIKNERVHALAREAARATGKTQTGAIEEALERLLEEYRDGPVAADQRRRLDAVHAIRESWRNRSKNDSPDRVREVEDLYDPTTGLPG